MKLDSFDRQLLNLVQEDAGRTSEDLAQRVALSPSAVQRRLRKLKDAGFKVFKSAAELNFPAGGRKAHFTKGV